jgi:hypothetical protein
MVILLEEIKEEVKHISKDYYVGMPILSLKQIEWLIEQTEKVEELEKEKLEEKLKYIKGDERK